MQTPKEKDEGEKERKKTRRSQREEVKVLMSARNVWEKNLNVSFQDKPNDHHHRREGKLSQSEIDRMVHEVEAAKSGLAKLCLTMQVRHYEGKLDV